MHAHAHAPVCAPLLRVRMPPFTMTIRTKACAPLLRVLGALASPIARLGVPHVDACGESDGGGPHGDTCAELAAELAALGARLLGLLEEQVA